jgi:hypothetical protein
LTRLTAARRADPVLRLLDDAATFRAATDDPTGFVEHDSMMVIDEIQLVPELLSAIKVTVDLDPTPGRFVLTGSSRILAMRILPDALPGRMEVIELRPFSQGELHGGPDGFVDAAFTRGPGLSRTSTLRKRDCLDRAVTGGFPDAVKRAPRRRTACLLDLAMEPRGDGVWAIATFTMCSVPDVTFVRSQRVVPDLRSEWDPEFAAMLFETHLIEWFHTDAKHRTPDAGGTVRN